MSYLQDRSLGNRFMAHVPPDEWPGSAFYDPKTVRAVQQRVDSLAAHMHQQLQAHETAMVNTRQIFDCLLTDLHNFSDCFQEAFVSRLVPDPDGRSPRIQVQVDPDRSVGILNILWHAISFTTRGNTKPLALNRPGRPPMFSGRIIALNGDFMDVHSNLQSPYFRDLLEQEIASLFVPADPSAPAVMSIRQRAGEELYFHQADAPRRFLLKVVELVCGGGFFHEQS